MLLEASWAALCARLDQAQKLPATAAFPLVRKAAAELSIFAGELVVEVRALQVRVTDLEDRCQPSSSTSKPSA